MGDGFVEYQRATPHGLRNQGWKDAADAIPTADGTLPEPPIALAEVQAYVYGAYVARAHLAREAGDDATQRPASARQIARSRITGDFFMVPSYWSEFTAPL